MAEQVTRRDLLKRLGVTIGAAAASAGSIVTPKAAEAQQKFTPKGNIPSTPYKTGHMTFFTGPAAVLGEQSYKGHILAAEEINAQGGLLGKRQIETLKADEAAGTDANVKELRRLKLSEKIDLFTGIISSGNTPALGPVAEEVKCLTLFVDGCTDFLFEKAVPDPHYIFRLTNIQSADGAMAAIAATTRVARGAEDRPHPSRLLVRAERLRPLQHRHEEAHPGQDRRRLRGVAEARDHRVHGAHHQDDLGEAGPPVLLGVGRRLRRLLQAGAPLRPVQEDEGGDHPRLRRRPARPRPGPPRGHRGRRPLELPLPLSAGEPLAAEHGSSSRSSTTAGRSTRTSRRRARTPRST